MSTHSTNQTKSHQHTRSSSAFPQTDSKDMHTLMECMSICAACAAKCIAEDHKTTARLCADCADICALTIKARSSHSEFEQPIVELCVQACQRCSEECQKVHATHCQECAQACQRCVEACSTAYSYA